MGSSSPYRECPPSITVQNPDCQGTKAGDDWPLRPGAEVLELHNQCLDLQRWISELALLRDQEPALREGDYQPLFNDSTLMGYIRQKDSQELMVWVNAEEEARSLEDQYFPPGIWVNAFSHEKVLKGVSIPPFGSLIFRKVG
jgi:glycosidase